MKTACFIPIKANSERIPGKNFKLLNGKKLYQYISEHVREAGVFDDVYIDTDSQEIAEYAASMGFGVIERKPELALNSANGNDLLTYHLQLYPDYDYYFQLLATAPYLQPASIQACFNRLISSEEYDSCFTASVHYSFFWMSGMPVNYQPGILPRSQDLTPLIEETTGMYGVSRDSLKRYRCRIGRNPYIHIVSKFEAVDINTNEDFKIAEYIGKIIYAQRESSGDD